MSPEDALRSFGRGWRQARVLRRLQATPQKASYLVARAGARYVLRLDRLPVSAIGLDRAAEFAILNAAAAAGVAPRPVALRDGALLLAYVPGRAWTAQELRDPQRLHGLGRLLRRVHAVQAPAAPRLDLARRIATYARLAGGRGARKRAASARDLIAAGGIGEGRTVLCHNDPIAANIVGTRPARLIDWEYAAIGDPLFDLAVVIGHHRLGRWAAATLAASYFNGLGAVPQDRLRTACAVYQQVEQLWREALIATGRLTVTQHLQGL